MARSFDFENSFDFTHEGAKFRAFVCPDDAREPWNESDGHGPVSDWRPLDSKRPGERILNRDRDSARFYDFAEACRIARRDGWSAAPHDRGTARQRAARAVEADFQRLRSWCRDEWHWIGVCVVKLTRAGDMPAGADPYAYALWGIESDGDEYHQEVARELASDILAERLAARSAAAKRAPPETLLRYPADMPRLLMQIPFEGCYNSWYSEAIDDEETRFCEDMCTEPGDGDRELDQPAHLRLTEQEHAEILLRVTDYSAAYEQVARYYVDAFNVFAEESLGRPLGLAFESLISPREYNFTTDRLFVHVPAAAVEFLFAESAAGDHAKLAAVIAARCTSRDGFCSHYSNKLATWLAKPVLHWDHNELQILLESVLTLRNADVDADDARHDLYDKTFHGDEAYHAWSSAVDWPTYDARVAEMREEKAAAYAEEHPDEPQPFVLGAIRDYRQISLPL